MRVRLSSLVVLVALATVATVVPALAAPAVLPVGTAAGAAPARLSDEVRVTRWAHPLAGAVVRAQPSGDGRAVGRLRTETEDARPEVVVALSSRRAAGETWVHVRFAPGAPGRPALGWVPRRTLGTYGVATGRLVVDRRRLRATFTDGEGRTRWSAPVGIGAPATPTPAGRFFVRERLRGADGGRGLYGPHAIGTSAYASVSDWPRGGVVGLHGTDAPELVPGRPSHGCVRLRNPDVTRLVRFVGPGTPVVVR